MLERIFPFLTWKDLITRQTLRDDLLAGLTGAIILLPQGVAFALIAGMPPEYGLYTAIVVPIVAALFGSSRQLITGPTTAMSIVVYSIVSQHAEPGSETYITLAITLAFLIGVYQLLLGLSRMGSLVNFVSHTVILGFTAGAALLIATSQIKHVLGIPLERGGGFIGTWMQVFSRLGEINPRVVLVAGVTLISTFILRSWIPKWPFLLFAMIIGSVVNILVDGVSHGVELVGALPGFLPPVSLPDLSYDTLQKLATEAFALALLGLIEAVSIAKAIALKTEQRIDGNQEFIGQGIGNLVGSFFSGYPSSGSFSRSGINFSAGAKTPLSAIFAALILVAILLFVAPLMYYLPIPAMGGVIMWVAYRLFDWKHMYEIINTNKQESLVLVTTFLSTLLLNLEFAIYIGVIMSIGIHLRHTARPRIQTIGPDTHSLRRMFHPADKKNYFNCPQLLILRIDGSIYFGAVNYLEEMFEELYDTEQPYLLIEATGITKVDLSGIDLLAKEATRREKIGGGLYFAGLSEELAYLVEKKLRYKGVPKDHYFLSREEAISSLFPAFDHSICATCSRRIFAECSTVPRL